MKKLIIAALALAGLASTALATEVPIASESGPDGNVVIEADMSQNGPTGIGIEATTSSGVTGGAEIHTNGSLQISGGANGFNGTVTTDPNGGSPSVGVTFGADF
jgi:hypothetical protein